MMNWLTSESSATRMRRSSSAEVSSVPVSVSTVMGDSDGIAMALENGLLVVTAAEATDEAKDS